jgi:hypothetical protein
MARNLLNGLSRVNDLPVLAREAAQRGFSSLVVTDPAQGGSETQPLAAYVVERSQRTAAPATVVSIHVEVQSQPVVEAVSSERDRTPERFDPALAQAARRYRELQSPAEPASVESSIVADAKRAAAAYAFQRSLVEPQQHAPHARMVDVRA